MVDLARIPIVVGVGDVVNHSTKLEDALEPLELIFRAIEEALQDINITDTGKSKFHQNIDSISIVRTWTWPYPDLPSLLSKKLNIHPKHSEYSDHGGNQPGRLFDEAARRISKGECQVAIVAGGEALASCKSTHNDLLRIWAGC